MTFDKLNEGEIHLVKWQYHMASGFVEALFHFLAICDDKNRNKMYLAFPEDTEAYRRFHSEPGYWKDVQKRAEIKEA